MKRVDSQRIVICGSMTHYEEMRKCKNYLEAHDIPIVIPSKDDAHLRSLSGEQFSEFKRNVSMRHFNAVKHHNTFGILVVNAPKNSQPNYIGMNTFAEIAVAFSSNKRIFLLYDVYEDCSSELISWEVEALHGNLTTLVKRCTEHIETSVGR